MSDYSATLITHLRATLGKMEVALGAIGDSIVWTNSSGRIQWSNSTFDRLVDRQRFDILGASLLDLLPLKQEGQNLAAEAHPLTKVLQQIKTTGIYEFRQSDKTLFLEISSAWIEFKGQETSAVLVIHDVTER
jgi:PAS domain-containing protein